MRVVNMHEAKTQLSALVEQAVRLGEPFVIAKAGKPMVKVVPASQEERPRRRIGFLQGIIKVPDDFDNLYQEEIEALFGVKP